MKGRLEATTEERAWRRRGSGELRSVVVSLAVLALILGGLWYWENRGGGAYEGPYGVVELPAEKNPTGLRPLPEVDRAGPDFLLEYPQSAGVDEVRTLRLSDLQGQPVLINFWATWCPPCRDEMPELVAAYARHQGQGLVIVGVNLQEADEKVLAFVEDYGISFPIVIDRSSQVEEVWRLGGPVYGIPTSYFLDETGVIRARQYGPMTQELLEERLAEILPAVAN